ncbi:MarR family transcriptional regulator, 2-MHQ and catechol-resistance regulon repressor [Seinonella peptonophila]|uniref:MarR family transcriptional regulator, 2-MHQ and catechol-resistance regulon repressor n=1 Tax=Seinonella peptonophila TaxID=112248 RepID=A0A1M4ZNU4_9BACL|nr:MarR family transcriptional regulator [Seinonella peptonophila]SHF19780.1 MarR family transcriptional regulator, 2-MHQ and catechol-resistance regulon repressor [Seinonella peptonophila]
MNDDTTLKLFIVLSRAYKSVMEHSQLDAKRHGLSLSEFSVLELLYSKGAFSLQAIGKKILLANASITYVIDKLEKKGYITRKPDHKDRRMILANLTPAGLKLMKEILPQQFAALNEAMDGLNQQEKELAIQLLKKLGISAKKKLS